MTPKRYVASLAPDALVWTPLQPAFASLAHQMLGNSATPSDGFEHTLAGVLSAFGDLAKLTRAITDSLSALDATQQALDRIPTADISSEINRGIAANRAAGAALDAAIAALKVSPGALAGVAPAPLPPIYNVAGIGVGQTGSVGVGGGNGVNLTQPVLATGLGAEIGLAATLSENALTAGSALAPILGEVAVFAPIVGVFVGLGLLLSQFIGKGCGNACIEAAKAEQIYEAMGDNLVQLYKLGMITRDQTLAGIALAQEYGAQHLGKFDDKQARAGEKNMTSVLSALVAGMAHTPMGKPQPYNLTLAHEHYISGPGWYPDSLAAAAQLTDEYVSSLR